eukprot:m51a1_g4944 hypothetical protein (126) ;mRNA; r:320095-320601
MSRPSDDPSENASSELPCVPPTQPTIVPCHGFFTNGGSRLRTTHAREATEHAAARRDPAVAAGGAQEVAVSPLVLDRPDPQAAQAPRAPLLAERKYYHREFLLLFQTYSVAPQGLEERLRRLQRN